MMTFIKLNFLWKGGFQLYTQLHDCIRNIVSTVQHLYSPTKGTMGNKIGRLPSLMPLMGISISGQKQLFAHAIGYAAAG